MTDRQTRNVYHQLNSIYSWDPVDKKFIKSNSGWVDDYLRLLRINNTGQRLRFVFNECFKKEKGQSTLIYHENHKRSLTEAEKRNAIFEVRDGSYINVVGSTYIYLPQRQLYTKLRLNFIRTCINVSTLRVFNLQLANNLSYAL